MTHSTTYAEARTAYKKVGASHATGTALCAMYADLIHDLHGGETAIYYRHLCKAMNDAGVLALSKPLLADRGAAWDVLMGF